MQIASFESSLVMPSLDLAYIFGVGFQLACPLLPEKHLLDEPSFTQHWLTLQHQEAEEAKLSQILLLQATNAQKNDSVLVLESSRNHITRLRW